MRKKINELYKKPRLKEKKEQKKITEFKEFKNWEYYKLAGILIIFIFLVSPISAYSNEASIKVKAYIIKPTKSLDIEKYEFREFKEFVKETYETTPIFTGFKIRVFEIARQRLITKNNEIQIEIGELKPNLWGWADMKTHKIKIDKTELDNKFLLEHETGHIYLGGHTNDNSIMDRDGGNRSFTQKQVKKVHTVFTQ